MDFELDAEQQAVLDAVATLVERHAGAERARELAAKAEYDFALERALDDAGFLAVASQAGPLEAVLVVEAVARGAGATAIAAGALVAPLVAERALPSPVALASASGRGPVRYAAHARTLLVEDGDEARVVALQAGDAEPVASSYGYPMGRPAPSVLEGGESLGPGSGERLRRWWRVALAAETVGTLAASLAVTLDHVKARRQFGRAIGSFQAVQHRLAECAIGTQAARWLAYEAAWQGAPAEGAALAAAHATHTAERVFAETHQLSGAIGYTHEHPLHVFSMRLPALRAEAGGVAAHRRAAARARWPS